MKVHPSARRAQSFALTTAALGAPAAGSATTSATAQLVSRLIRSRCAITVLRDSADLGWQPPTVPEVTAPDDNSLGPLIEETLGNSL